MNFAYQGEIDSFSFQAAESFARHFVRQLPATKIELLSCATFLAAFAAADQKSTAVVVPIENFIAGFVYETVTLLAKSNLQVVGVHDRKVELCLAVKPKSFASLATLQEVHSHPKALEQCGKFFKAHPQIKAVRSGDTALAAHQIALLDDGVARGALCSVAAARRHGLQIVQENIQDEAHNSTRFVCLVTADAADTVRAQFDHGDISFNYLVALPLEPSATLANLCAAVLPKVPGTQIIALPKALQPVGCSFSAQPHMICYQANKEKLNLGQLRISGWRLESRGSGSLLVD